MKRFGPCLAMVGLVFFSSVSPAVADSSLCTAKLSFPKLPPLPCLWPKDWTLCNNYAQYVNNYNQWVQLVNDSRRIACENVQWFRNPYQYASHIASDIQSEQDIEKRAGALIAQDKDLDAKFKDLWPDFNPGYDTTAMDDKLDQLTYNSMLGVLKGAGMLSTVSPADLSAVDAIKKAAANAKNPTEAEQMNVQLSAVIYDQLVKQTQFTALKLSQTAQYDMAQAARERAARQASARAAEAQAVTLYPAPPTLTQTQVRQLETSWSKP